MKKNEKKIKNNFGVFNGNTISQETFGLEKSLVIHELEEQDFTIEKSDDRNVAKNTMFVDEQALLNKKRKLPLKLYVKWIIALLILLIVVGIIIFVAIKFSL